MDLVGFLCHFVFSMQAVKGALHMLENGASIADAKSVCPPNVLFQLVKWKVHGNVELSSWLFYTNYVLLLFFMYLQLKMVCIYYCSSLQSSSP